MKIVVLDMASLQYRLNRTQRRVVTSAATGEVLSRLDVGELDERREIIFLAADAALDQGAVLRSGEVCRVGLYNPYSGEVAVNSVPATRVFSAGVPLVLHEAGNVFELLDDRLVGDGVVLDEVIPTMASTSRALLAHSLN